MPTHPEKTDPAAANAKAEQQKKEARAPQVAKQPDAAKPTPPQSGKPVWDKPHSS